MVRERFRKEPKWPLAISSSSAFIKGGLPCRQHTILNAACLCDYQEYKFGLIFSKFGFSVCLIGMAIINTALGEDEF